MKTKAGTRRLSKSGWSSFNFVRQVDQDKHCSTKKSLEFSDWAIKSPYQISCRQCRPKKPVETLMITRHVNCLFDRSHYEKLAQWQVMLQEMDTLQQHNTDASRAAKHVPSVSGAQIPIRSKCGAWEHTVWTRDMCSTGFWSWKCTQIILCQFGAQIEHTYNVMLPFSEAIQLLYVIPSPTASGIAICGQSPE